MFAIIKTGGKQYTVRAEDVITIERLEGEAGDQGVFDNVLMVGDNGKVDSGKPYVEGASVAYEILEQSRGEKIIVFKKRRRQKSERTKGHRQNLSSVKILEILTGGKKASVKPATKKAAPKAEEKAAPAKKAAPKAETKAAPAKKAAPKAEANAESGAIFQAPEGKKDNLKKLAGCGPAFEKNLNALGITTFQQIADLTADDVARVEEALNASGRFERENWVAQAKELAASA